VGLTSRLARAEAGAARGQRLTFNILQNCSVAGGEHHDLIGGVDQPTGAG
jgi:hypothetical protein